jgi:hypothetical protein
MIYYAGSNTQNGVDLIATGAGNNDWVHGIGTDTLGKDGDTTVQHDAVSGGAGNDYVGIIGTNFTSLNGGGGANTLVFEGSNLTLNLTEMGLRVHNFETFYLNNQSNNASTDPRNQFTGETTGNTLQLSLSDILSENGAPGPVSNTSTAHIMILGDSTSTVQLDGTTALTGWTHLASTQTVGTVVFDVYQSTVNSVAELLIQHNAGISVI